MYNVTSNINNEAKQIVISNEATNEKIVFDFMSGKTAFKRENQVKLTHENLTNQTTSKANVIKNHMNYLFNNPKSTKDSIERRISRFAKALNGEYENLNQVTKVLIDF